MPEINFNEGNEEIILADLPPSLIEIDNADCLLRSSLEQGCFSGNRADDDVHNISCEVVNVNDYHLGWNEPHWSPYNALGVGQDMSAAEYQAIRAEEIRQVVERAVPVDFSVTTYHDDLLLSSNQPIVTIGAPPVLPVEFVDTPIKSVDKKFAC